MKGHIYRYQPWSLLLSTLALTLLLFGNVARAADKPLPSLAGATKWLNSPELTPENLMGKVVLVNFWTYGCINCQRALPYVKSWDEKYRDKGLVVIGIHSPEFAYERKESNVLKAIKRLGINYPVVTDNDFTLWERFDNQYWPTRYLADAEGNVRYEHIGEGDYDGTEKAIQQLLREAKAG
ncbi:redoxin family protein [Pantoea sp.]|uniref:redoxin family protein n=1 Tax=Pantoea sp. TaxID=69393 RepID=UPI0031CE0FFC